MKKPSKDWPFKSIACSLAVFTIATLPGTLHAQTIVSWGAAENIVTVQSGSTAALSWFDYTPGTSMITIGSAATPNIDNITAVGYRVDLLNTAGLADQQRAIRIQSIDVAAIPEPSTVALLAGSLAGIASLRRNRRKSVL